MGPSLLPGKSSTTPTISCHPPSRCALRRTSASRAARGFSVAVPDAAAQRVCACPPEPRRRRIAEDFCDERTIDDHRRAPRAEVTRIKTAPGEKARAEDLEKLVVYRVESCLGILRLTPLHLDISGGFFQEFSAEPCAAAAGGSCHRLHGVCGSVVSRRSRKARAGFRAVIIELSSFSEEHREAD